MNQDYSSLSDEELLSAVYISKTVRTGLEFELALRLEHALDQLARPAKSLETLLNEHP